MKLSVALMTDGRWHIHRTSCQDMKRIKSQREAVSIARINGTVDEAVAWTLDDEMKEMGYGMESIHILPCTKGDRS